MNTVAVMPVQAQKQVANTGLFLTPSNLTEAMKIADILANSDFVPKDYQRKPGNILVALQWGAEIGLQPLQALQNIACINGRPAIWGDAMLALVRQSGLLESIDEEQTDDVATCTIKRRGEKERVVTFSMADAKRAGLSGKVGPWTQYPKRMMQSRARAYALRDIFPDVLKGMAVAEEEQDKQTLVDVTPQPVPSKTASVRDKVAAKKQGQVIDQPAHAESVTPVEGGLDKVVSAIEVATTVEELAEYAKSFGNYGLSEGELKQVRVLYAAKKQALIDAAQSQEQSPEDLEAIRQFEERNGSD